MLALSSVCRVVCDAGVTEGVGSCVWGEFSLGAVVVQRPLAGFTLAAPSSSTTSTSTLATPLQSTPCLSPCPLFLILWQQNAPEVLPHIRGEVHHQVFFTLFPLLFFTPLSLFRTYKDVSVLSKVLAIHHKTSQSEHFFKNQ